MRKLTRVTVSSEIAAFVFCKFSLGQDPLRRGEAEQVPTLLRLCALGPQAKSRDTDHVDPKFKQSAHSWTSTSQLPVRRRTNPVKLERC